MIYRLAELALALVSSFSFPAIFAQSPPVVFYESPRLTALAKSLDSADVSALDRFWEEVSNRAPLIECVGPDRDCLVTFLWRGTESTRSVDMLGEVPTTNTAKWGMRRFGNTDLWFKTERVPKSARFGYAIRENGSNFKLDPLNPRSFAGRSIVELPDAPPQRWIQPRSGAPKGKLAIEKIASTILSEERTLGVYLPPVYDPGSPSYNLIVLLDGEAYGTSANSQISTATILDNLIAEGRIRPTVAVLVNSISQQARDRDLLCSSAFADFLETELVVWARKKFHAGMRPATTVIGGSSYGGLAAAYIAFRHPEVFGNVLSQSGTFSYFPNWKQNLSDYTTETGWLTRQYVTASKLPVRFYLEVGIFEGGPIFNLLRENRHLRDVLQAKGYTVFYSEFAGGHDYLTWRNSLGDGIIALLGIQGK